MQAQVNKTVEFWIYIKIVTGICTEIRIPVLTAPGLLE